MKHLRILSLYILLVIPVPGFASDHSNVFTVDMSKMLKFTIPGKYILSENNKSRSKLQKENDIRSRNYCLKKIC